MPLPVGPPPMNEDSNNTNKSSNKNGINYTKSTTNSAPARTSTQNTTPATQKRANNKPSLDAGATRVSQPMTKTAKGNIGEGTRRAPSNNRSETASYYSEIIDGEEWRTDKQTGRKYKVLPPTEWLEDGTSVCHMDDVDGFTDLNMSASTYLAHLQVPPTKKELSDIRAENAKKREQKKL